MKQFQDRVAVITGAGSGIGQALAQMLAQRGCHLALVDVNQSGLEQTRSQVEDSGAGVNLSLHQADVSDKERMMALPQEVLAEHGRVHLLVNNAGVGVYKNVADQSIEDMEWIIGINLWGVIYGCKFFLPHLLEQEEAHIVNVSSMLGLIGLPSQGSYSATKFAVRGFSEALWRELKQTPVKVSIVHPGAVKTNILNTARYGDEETEQKLKKIMDRFAPEADKAAKKILKGIQKEKHRILVCPETYLMDWGKRMFPTLMNKLAG